MNEAKFKSINRAYPVSFTVAPKGGTRKFGDRPSVDRRARSIVVLVDVGHCVNEFDHAPRFDRVEVREEPEAILLRTWVRYTGRVPRERPDVCAGVGGEQRVRVTLPSRLGPRAVVDLEGGYAVNRKGMQFFDARRPLIELRPVGRDRLKLLSARFNLGRSA